MMTVRGLLFLSLMVLLVGCTPVALPPPVNHNGPLPTGTPSDCQRACDNLRKLHCSAGEPTSKGASCEEVCMNTESSGYASMNPRCEATASSCEAADACADEAPPESPSP